MQLSVKDAAGVLNVSEKTIYRWIKQAVIPAYRINEQYRFNRTELLEWATSRRIQVSPTIFAEGEPSSTPLPSLLEALRAGGVAYRVSGRDQASVLQSIVEFLQLPEEVDREFLYKVLLARESLGSTGIGDGIAIPHVEEPRSPPCLQAYGHALLPRERHRFPCDRRQARAHPLYPRRPPRCGRICTCSPGWASCSGTRPSRTRSSGKLPETS